MTKPANNTKVLLREVIEVLLRKAIGSSEIDEIPTPSCFSFSPSPPFQNISATLVLLSWGMALPIICSLILFLRQKWPCDCGGALHRQPTHTTRCPVERLKFLDTVLPLLLQTSLILLCASFVLHLYHLNTAVCMIVGISLFIGLAVSSAVYTDPSKLSPFHDRVNACLSGLIL